VAGDDEGDWVAAVGGPDRPGRPGPPDPPGLLGVTERRPIGDRQQRLPGEPLERRAREAERDLEGAELAPAVSAAPAPGTPEGRILATPTRPGRRRGTPIPPGQVETGQGLAVGGQQQVADRTGIDTVERASRLVHGGSPIN